MSKFKTKFWILIILVVIASFLIIKFQTTEKTKDLVDLSYLNLDDNTYIFEFSAILDYYFTKKPEYNIENVFSERDKKKFDKQLREKLIELLNMPFKQSEKIMKVLEEKDKGKYTETKVRLLITDNVISEAYLLVPKNIEFPAPAVIAMHQHGGNYEYGKEEVVGNIGDSDLAYGKELAERGYIVLAMDAPLFGAGSQIGYENSPETAEIFNAQGLFVLGHSPLGVIVQEDIISLDYLSSLDIVDKENIGCIGHSFGGIRCMYLSALDKRIKVTVLSSSVANLKFNYEVGNTHTWLAILPGIVKYTETSGILALISPRALKIFYTEKDPIYPQQEAEKQLKALEKIYTRLDKKEKLEAVRIINRSHEFPIEYHQQAYEFLDKNLKT